MIQWAYGITTIPERFDTHLPRTVESLWFAGFKEPRLFVDGLNYHRVADYVKKFHLPVSPRYPRIFTYKNWLMALQELYLRNPTADRFVIFQDDIVTYNNLRLYLESVSYPIQGYCNLYSTTHNERIVPRNDAGNPMTGWYPSNQKGMGALALMFNNFTARLLLTSSFLIERTHHPVDGNKSVDGAVLLALLKHHWPEYVHYPSLVQHTGMVTTMGTPQHPESESFMGEDIDAMIFTKDSKIHTGPIPQISQQLK